jgi:hypothetical protein
MNLWRAFSLFVLAGTVVGGLVGWVTMEGDVDS